MNLPVLIAILGLGTITSCNDRFSVRKRLIVGGDKIDIGQVPYQVIVQLGDMVVCGGSLIAPSWILLASHCLWDIRGYEHLLEIRAGSKNRLQGGEVRTVKWSTLHPNYDRVHLHHDIALLFLNHPMVFGPNVKCIRMPEQDYMPRARDDGFVAGWGLTNADHDRTKSSNYPKELLGVKLPVLGFRTCNRWYNNYTLYQDTQFCAGYPEGKRDACVGDSGGPYVVGRMQVGVVSWGLSCAKPRQPGVFTDVGMYRNWIETTMFKIQGSSRGLKCKEYF
uniref:trypsin n=1 Tax=Culex tarsalis TaxID=7177 RepID=A0A1Q3FTV2_CULTA